MAAWSRTQILLFSHTCDIMTFWKMDEHKGVDDIEKKVGIFHVLNGILAKTRNLIYKEKKRFPGHIVDS